MVQGIVATGLEDFKALPFAHVANLKPSSPLRPPSWRWERAMALRQSGRGLRRTRDDDCVLTSPYSLRQLSPHPDALPIVGRAVKNSDGASVNEGDGVPTQDRLVKICLQGRSERDKKRGRYS